MTDAEAETFYAELVGRTAPKSLRDLVSLAFAQLTVEDLRESDPDWGAAIESPKDAATPAMLRAILSAAEARGVKPNPEGDEEANWLLASGCYLRNPAIRSAADA